MVKLCTAQLDGLGQEFEGILCSGHIFLSDKTIKSCCLDGLGDGGIVELLRIIEFMPAGNSCGVIMADMLVIGLDGSDDVTLHDLHMIDIVEQFEMS